MEHPGTHQYQHDTYVTFDEYNLSQVLGGSSSSTSQDYATQLYAYQFSANIANPSTTDQAKKLQYYLNMYQEYRLSEVEVTYNPLATYAVANSFYTGDNPPKTSLSSQLTCANQIIWAPEHDDGLFVYNDSVVGEYDFYKQMHSLPHAEKFLSVHTKTIKITPSMLEAGDIENAVNNFNNNLIKFKPWVRTKVNTASATYGLNDQIVFFGLKIATWNPLYSQLPLQGTPVTKFLGTLTFKYTWTFRYRDNLSIVAPATMMLLDGTPAKYPDSGIDHVQGLESVSLVRSNKRSRTGSSVENGTNPEGQTSSSKDSGTPGIAKTTSS